MGAWVVSGEKESFEIMHFIVCSGGFGEYHAETANKERVIP
jgi:hypothetical protein